MITWFGVRDETSSGILYSLQWLKGRLRKSRETVNYRLRSRNTEGLISIKTINPMSITAS